MKNIFQFLFIFIFHIVRISASIDCDKQPRTPDAILKKQLFCGEYDKNIRPRENVNDPTKIRIAYKVKSYDFDDDTQKMSMTSWLGLRWIDKNLAWTPNDHGQLDQITIYSELLWVPDLVVYNSESDASTNDCESVDCRVFYTGDINCVLPCSHDSICDADYKRWPFDKQSCTLQLGSWFSRLDEIVYDMENATALMRLHNTHKKWDMVSIDKKLVIKHKDGKRDPVKRADTSAIFYTFNIERHSAIHRAMIFAPAIIMISMNLIALWLDLRCTDRILILCVNLLIHTFYNEILFWSVPYNGDILPDVMVFFRDSLSLTAAIIMGTVLIRGMARLQSLPPLWIESTNNFLISNPLGIYFSMGSLEEKPFSAEVLEDGQNLVDSSNGGPSAICNGVTKENIKWRQFAKIIDRLLFAACLIAYIILFIIFIPANNN